MNAARRHRLAAMLTGTVLAGSPANSAQPVANPAPLTEAEIQAGRERDITDILTGPWINARMTRLGCAKDDYVASTEKLRANGRSTTADASDRCLAAMHRAARGGDSLNLYDLLLPFIGEMTIHGDAVRLPQKIADAIAHGSDAVTDATRGQPLKVTSGMALDTGYTAAYGDGPAANPPGTVIDPAKLKAATEKCVSQQGNNKVCFTVGYVQGAAAWRSDNPSASREPGAVATREAPSR